MKQTKWLALITAMTLLTMLCSCKDSVTPSGGDSDGGGGTVAAGNVGDIALADIVINGTTYDKTTEVYVTGPNGATITGSDPSFVDSGAYDYLKGVFRTGRTVTLSPYIMSKYEVTQELYQAVMTGNSDGINATPSCYTDSPATGEE